MSKEDNYKHNQPPKWPLKLMRFFLNIDYLEEIEGDMEEVYYDNIEQFSKRKADWKYTVDMLQLIRPSLISKHSLRIYFNWHLMFKNYFKISVRGLLKNPLNSFINVFGLAIALGFCVFAYSFANAWVDTLSPVLLTAHWTKHDCADPQHAQTNTNTQRTYDSIDFFSIPVAFHPL